MKRIALTQGKFALVDDDLFDYLNQWKWNFNKGTGYVQRLAYLGKIDGKYVYKHQYMHRLILNPPEGFDTDHINHSKLDNQRKNLRIATRRQNLQNKINSKRKNSDVPMGVGEHKGLWRARITVNRKEIFLGDYNTFEEAGIAYNWASLKYFKEFANFNNIPNWREFHPFRHKIYINIKKTNTSGVVGVSFLKRIKRW